MAEIQTVPKFTIPMRYRVRRFLHAFIPGLVWTIAVLVGFTLYSRTTSALVVRGFATEVSYTVAPETAGRLGSLHVTVNEHIASGHVLASLDDSELRLVLAEAKAELGRISAELTREDTVRALRKSEKKTSDLSDLRRFVRDQQLAHIRYLKGVANLAEDRAKLKGLKARLDRTEGLENVEVATGRTLDKDRSAFDAVKNRIEKSEPLVATMRKRWNQAQSDYAIFLKKNSGDAIERSLLLEPFRYAIQVQQSRIEQANLSLEKLLLRAPVDAVVANILRRPGEVVAAGEPVLRLIRPFASEILAYVPEERLLEVKVNQIVRLERRAAPGQIIKGRIAQLGSELVELPPRANPGSRMPVWGFPVSIALSDDLKIRPGESFTVKFMKGDG